MRYAAGRAGHPSFPGADAWRAQLGRYWSHDYAIRIVQDPDDSHVWLITRFATFREFTDANADDLYETVAPTDEYRTLIQTVVGWELEELDDTVHAFDTDGKWLSTTDRNGNAKTATYDIDGNLITVDFPDGRREELTYHPDGKLATITEVGVDGTTMRQWSYTWSGNPNLHGDSLIRIDRPDSTALEFFYDAGVPGLPSYLSHVELVSDDGTSRQVLRAWEYDSSGNAIKTWRGDVSSTGPDAVDVWTFSYDDPSQPTQTTVTDPLGDTTTYNLEYPPGTVKPRITSVSGPCAVCNVGPNTSFSYGDPDYPQEPTLLTDGRGFETALAYDPSAAHTGELVSRTEAANTGLSRTTTWEYDDVSFPAFPTAIEQDSTDGDCDRRTEFLYDAAGNATSRTLSGCEAGAAFSLTTAMNYNAAGQVITIDPPGFGTQDETGFIYDSTRGEFVPLSRTDPLVGTTSFIHDEFNRRTEVTDPNGLSTVTTYDALDRVTETRQQASGESDLVTTHTYNPFGDLATTTLPRGNQILYGYDAAGRLTSIERRDASGTERERTLLTLDAAGNRILEELQTWTGSAWQTEATTEFDYEASCKLASVTQAPGTPEEAVTAYTYDANLNLATVADPNHTTASTTYAYDALNRLTDVTQPFTGGTDAVTSYAYDVQDHLTQVTDPEGNLTTYTYSDRDLLTEQVSPVSGTTTHAYNDHGELVATTDARGVTESRTVDAADRVTEVDYPDNTLDTTFTYDTCTNGLGRLCSITRDGESVSYAYDPFGRILQDGALSYAYDANGNRTEVAYPGGVTATYAYDFADRPETLAVASPGGSTSIVDDADYLPSGPLASLTLGNGVTETRTFDGRYVPTQIALSGALDLTWDYTTDPVGNILSTTRSGTSCLEPTLVIDEQTLTGTQSFESCALVQGGPNTVVATGADITFRSGDRVELHDDFTVEDGALFTAEADPSITGGGEVTKTYQYRDFQYFLTAADGPWGSLSWTYDKIGNRLTETRDGTTDNYDYTPAGSPILDSISLGVGGTADYTWDAAGNLDSIDRSGNLIDFSFNDASRLAEVSRPVAFETATFSYDGRSFLKGADQTAGGTGFANPVYSSQRQLHKLTRQDDGAGTSQEIFYLYLAGRPVAQLLIEGSSETYSFLTTDHLGTPLLATDEAGAVTWAGAFEPFGADWQAQTSSSALSADLGLRLPGQFDDPTWEDATLGAPLYYNVHRWYEYGTGRYTRVDPAGVVEGDAHPYAYARSNPLSFMDPLAEKSRVCCRKLGALLRFTGRSHCYIEIENSSGNTTCGLYRIDGVGQIKRNHPRDSGGQCGEWNPDCSADRCAVRVARSYPNPSQYSEVGMLVGLGANSNTFASNIADVCGLTPPSLAAAGRAPGWGNPPPYRQPGMQPEPVRCTLP